MDCSEIKYYLKEYAGGLLPPEAAKIIEKHIRRCKKCRNEIDELKLAKDPLSHEDDAIWIEINKNPERGKKEGYKTYINYGRKTGLRENNERKGKKILIAGSILIIISCLVIFLMFISRHTVAYWNVESLAGNPEINHKNFSGYSFLQTGDLLTTNRNSKVMLRTGSVGSIVIGPNSRVKLAVTSSGTHKIDVELGHAEISRWGSPFVFYIDTPAGLFTDHGSDYNLTVVTDSVILHCESGSVLLQYKGEESIIPAGADCVSKKDIGPGTPFYSDASQVFISALNNFDFPSYKDSSLSVILSLARTKDVLSLWHLLFRTQGEDQKKVYDTLNARVIIPKEIDFSKVAIRDKSTLNKLGEYLRIGTKTY